MIRQIKKGITYAESKDADARVTATVASMLNEVSERGDAAVRELSKRLDKWSPESFRLSAARIKEIVAGLPGQVIEDIKFAQMQIRNHDKFLIANFGDHLFTTANNCAKGFSEAASAGFVD